MISAAIGAHFPELKPTEKLLLVTLIARFQPVCPTKPWRAIREGGDDLARMFGLSKTATFSGLAKLKELGVIQEERLPRPTGRPKKIRRISPLFGEILDSRKSSVPGRFSSVAANLLQQRLAATNPDLRPAEFLLLLVLLIFADERGVTAGLSHKDLSNLTCIPHSQIRRHISKLTAKHQIKALNPGLVEGRLLGHANTIYYLAMDTAPIQKTGISVKTVKVFLENHVDATNEIRREIEYGPRHFDTLGSKREIRPETVGRVDLKTKRIDEISWRTIAPTLLERSSVRSYLQRGIERYASILLDEPLAILSRSAWMDSQDLALTKFMAVLINTPHTQIANQPSDALSLRGLCTDLEMLCHEFAERVQKNLKIQKSQRHENTVIHRILPPCSEDAPSFTVEQLEL